MLVPKIDIDYYDIAEHRRGFVGVAHGRLERVGGGCEVRRGGGWGGLGRVGGSLFVCAIAH